MKENNKIIAEFMGLKLGSPYMWRPGSFSPLIIEHLAYHKSWDWLMQIVEKIESIKDPYHGRFGVYISSNSCTIQSTNFRPDKPIPNTPHYYDNIVLNTKIESVYYSVINFINFYNKQEEE